LLVDAEAWIIETGRRAVKDYTAAVSAIDAGRASLCHTQLVGNAMLGPALPGPVRQPSMEASMSDENRVGLYSRRDFGKFALAALPAAGLIGRPGALFALQAKPNS